MSLRPIVVPVVLALAAGALLAFRTVDPPPPAQAQPAAPAGSVPKTIILGFDGMDHALTQRFMDAGLMPNFKRLAEQGTFQRLETSNPAQSPVSWAVFNTGCNPGKTGVAGFVSRMFSEPRTGRDGKEVLPVPQPQMMLGFAERIPADDFVEYPLALSKPGSFRMQVALLGVGAGLLLGLVLLKLVFRTGFGPAFAFALVVGAAGGYGGWRWADGYVASLPADGKLPYVVNPMQGTSFWSYLDAIGVRTRGLQVASTYPPDHEGKHTKLLSGLGVMDVTGSPGSYTIYTNDTWTFSDKGTSSGGKIIKLFEDEPGVIHAKLVGPRNWFEQVRFETRLKELGALKGTADAPKDLDAQIKAVQEEQAQWRGRDDGKATVPFTMAVDKVGHAIEFAVGGGSGGGSGGEAQAQKFRVEQGGWSDFIPVNFVLSERYSARGLANFHVLQCDDKEVRVFVPPINIDPEHPPEQLPISAPGSFAAELVDEVGHDFETLGWACITNPLKDWEDTHLPEQSFLDDMVSTEALREELMMESLERSSEWDVFFQVFSTPDRVCHMLFRESDPGHPAYDKALAETMVTAWGHSFPLSEAIPQVYAQEDRLVGRVLQLIDSGALGQQCLLLLVSDHGFSSFRRQVNLNNVLADLGYLVFLEGLDVASARESGRGDQLQYVDWPRTRAYSLGLGEVFINLRGREPQGIVPPEEYDALVESIRKDLLALKDEDGTGYVTTASRRDALYDGPWWKEGTATRKVRGKDVEVHHDGFADIFLGYAPHYRVAWSNTLGGLDAAAVTDNTNHWSGDHVSVDPSHVPGILFSNRRLAAPAESSLMDIGPTVLKRYGVDPSPPHTEMDGRPLSFELPSR
jgi:hypothetical protein